MPNVPDDTVSRSLTTEQKIIAAYLSRVRGLTQQDICIALNCGNIGRVNEAVKAIVHACGEGDGGYKVSATSGVAGRIEVVS